MQRNVAIVVVGLLITMSAVAALVADRLHVQSKCKDVRIGMDGAIDAIIESGGLTTERTQIDFYTSHNRKKIFIGSVPVNHQKNKGADILSGDEIKMIVRHNIPGRQGRSTASVVGDVGGERVSVNMSCTN